MDRHFSWVPSEGIHLNGSKMVPKKNINNLNELDTSGFKLRNNNRKLNLMDERKLDKFCSVTYIYKQWC